MENLCILCIDVKVAYLQIPENIISLKHPETNSSSLKMDGWHTISFPLGPAILFRGFGCLSFREGNLYHLFWNFQGCVTFLNISVVGIQGDGTHNLLPGNCEWNNPTDWKVFFPP